jgi:hypothetical protein
MEREGKVNTIGLNYMVGYCLTSMLSKRDRQLLLETKRLLEEILETEEILADKKLMFRLKKSDEDVEAGQILTLDELKNKLK